MFAQLFMKKFLSSVVLAICLISLITGFMSSGCANIIPPTGGPRDSLPPVLVNAVPKDSTINFKGNKIVLTFNEYVQLDNNLNQDLIVSPNPEKIPAIEGKLRTVTIKLKDSLKPNTTYAINFGNSLKDVNENNPLKEFTYVFSTGSTIADGSITGNVILAETGEADSTLIVVLHSNLNDSAVKKNKPDYYTKIDSSGNFHFKYLPSEKYALYVLPNDYSKKYDDSTKMFAFYNEPVEAGTNPQKIQLYAYQQEKLKEKPAAPSASSSGKKEKSEEDKRLRFASNLENNEQDLLDSFDLVFNRPVTKFDSSLVMLTDTLFKPIKGYKIMRADTVLKKISIIYPWPENEAYKLIIQKEAFADSTGVTLSKSDTISFKTKRESEYGSIRLHFNNIDLSKNPVLQMMQNSVLVKSIPLTKNEWYEKLFKPGEYSLRLLFDNNKNGLWDPGNFDEKKQPETVQRIKRSINIKPNWDNEVDINL